MLCIIPINSTKESMSNLKMSERGFHPDKGSGTFSFSLLNHKNSPAYRVYRNMYGEKSKGMEAEEAAQFNLLLIKLIEALLCQFMNRGLGLENLGQVVIDVTSSPEYINYARDYKLTDDELTDYVGLATLGLLMMLAERVYERSE